MTFLLKAEASDTLEPYQPCALGLHVCGIDPVRDTFVSVLNVRCATARQAKDLFDRARHACESPRNEPFDLVVDLLIGGDIAEDFTMRRQQFEALKALAGDAH